MPYTPDTSYFTDLFGNLEIAGQSWIGGILLIAIILPMVTRNTEKWKVLALPLTLGLWANGVPEYRTPTWLLIIIIFGIMFAIEAYSTANLGSLIRIGKGDTNEST